MAIPSWGEYTSLTTMYEQRDQQAVVVGEPPVTPGVSWRIGAVPGIELQDVYMGVEDMTRLLRIGGACGLVVVQHELDTSLAAFTEPDEACIDTTPAGVKPEDPRDFPLWQIAIDPATAELAVEKRLFDGKDTGITRTDAWAMVANSAVLRGLHASVTFDTTAYAQPVTEHYLSQQLIGTARTIPY